MRVRVLASFVCVCVLDGAVANPVCPSGTVVTLFPRCSLQDHWGPLLGIDDGTGRATSVLIREFKQKHGELAWGAKEDELLRWANKELNSTTGIWEDVRGDGSSAGSWFRWKNQPVDVVTEIMRRR